MPFDDTISDDAAPRAGMPLERLVDAPWFWLALMFAVSILVPFAPVPNQATAIIGAIALIAFWVVAVVQFAVLSTRRLSIRPQVAWLVGSLAVWAAMEYVVAPLVGHSIRANMHRGGEIYTGTKVGIYALNALQDLALLNAAVAGGSLVARLVTSPNMMGPICGIVAMIDIWGVLFGGIVSQLIEKAPHIARKAMAAAPTVGAATGSHYVIPQPAIGAGDYLFLGLLFAALHQNEMNWRGARLWTMPLMFLALGAIMLGVPALPGLLFIGLGVALPNLRYFRYTRDEKFALLYAGLLVIVLTVVLYFVITSQLPAKPG